MKRRFIITAMITLLEMLNLAPANADAAVTPQSGNSTLISQSSTVQTPPAPPEEYLEIIKLLKEQLELKEKQLSAIEGTYKAITDETIITDPSIKAKREIYDKLFLKNSDLFYKKNKNSDALYQQILKEEKEAAEKQNPFISNLLGRLRYASVTDRAINLHALQASDRRFKYILSLLDTFEKAKNLQEIANFQANVDGILAMIENESIKLQIATQLRDAEYALTKTQKREFDMKTFDSKNTKMPTIKFP
ncbi:type IV secretion system protein [Bartonella sp. B1099]|uniref:type IV secretion system protein n=1 Tax=Bartonella sp. B1099 TaxID=2911422 RepID=UPI0020C211E5|nr:type IV secretion system protein [Bartonella sp. B1099]